MRRNVRARSEPGYVAQAGQRGYRAVALDHAACDRTARAQLFISAATLMEKQYVPFSSASNRFGFRGERYIIKYENFAADRAIFRLQRQSQREIRRIVPGLRL